MIADKASIVVNQIFDNYQAYEGFYVLIGGILYSIQLYTDFLSCTTIAQGVAELFAVEIVDNFKHPYFSVSIKDFWRRWHISLSSWLRDYIYIPLGGNRKGVLRKYINLIITFLISGLWHGNGLQFLLWGALHAIYQIVGEKTTRIRDKAYALFKMPERTLPWVLIKTIGTFFWVMLAWIIFRAPSIGVAFEMITSMIKVYNPWIFFDDSLLRLGLDWKDWTILNCSIVIAIIVSYKQTKTSIRGWINSQHLLIRWSIYIGAIVTIMLFGTYGFGFDSQDFIYGGF